MPNKVYPSPRAALEGMLFDGMTIMSGGFGLSGNPESLIPAIRDAGTKELTVISNNCGADGFGLWMLLANGQIRKMISSYIGENKLFERLCLSGKLELELNPQGTLAERIRAGGAGIPAFYTRTGVGTVVAEGKPVEEFDGELYVRETWLKADLAIVKAWRADPAGNLMFRKTARNFNPNMATAAKVTVAEVEEIVEAGAFDPDCVHTPGIYVNRIVKSTTNEKLNEKLTTRTKEVARCPLRRRAGPATRWRRAPQESFETATTSILASAYRPWSQTMFPRTSRSRSNRTTTCSASDLSLTRAK